GTLTDDGLRPSSLKSYRPNDFVLRNGFPYAPPLWMHAATLVSSTGEYLSGDREDAFDVDIPAHTRFIASDSTWDDVAFRWDPALTSGIDYAFEGAPGSSPVLDEVTYRIGKEVITKPAFYFTPGTFLASSFNSGIDDAVQFTITLALAL